jgi:hypothetical protein
MRPSGDRRPDDIVPRELLETIGEERVAFVLEDGNSLCHSWRGEGLTCYQVAEENLEGRDPRATLNVSDVRILPQAANSRRE